MQRACTHRVELGLPPQSQLCDHLPLQGQGLAIGAQQPAQRCPAALPAFITAMAVVNLWRACGVAAMCASSSISHEQDSLQPCSAQAAGSATDRKSATMCTQAPPRTSNAARTQRTILTSSSSLQRSSTLVAPPSAVVRPSDPDLLLSELPMDIREPLPPCDPPLPLATLPVVPGRLVLSRLRG